MVVAVNRVDVAGQPYPGVAIPVTDAPEGWSVIGGVLLLVPE